MEFFEKVVENFSGNKSSSSGGGYPQQQQQGPPPVSPPWVALWDEREQRHYYVNEQTGERTWTHPGQGSGYGGGYGYASQEQPQQQQQGSNHNIMYGVAGAAAGVVGGALLMHEGEKIHDNWEEDKDRIEQGVSDFPEDAANWTGQKVGEVQGGWDRAENKFDNAVDDVEEFPENVAGWAGEKVGDAERFGDNMENAYDDGKEEGRYGERYDGW